MTTDPSASDGPGPKLAAEDAKLLVLARSARLRAYVPDGSVSQGAALRDTDGRTYIAATLGLARADLAISALRAAIAAAVSSGARRFEAAAIVTGEPTSAATGSGGESTSAATGSVDGLTADDRATLAEFGPGVPVFLAGPDGALRARTTS
ncbi:cytidine deaminase [Frankia sp. R82]|uniref:cytidine deaminase n=1 Tax=Frankia sp. R82 TaxID=2950553 RepID=UPI00204482F4|nr:cytidine deaminase [Frankia sp. R82]MCM3883957.1 cytidine deaminase [Frankia sp. R82]